MEYLQSHRMCMSNNKSNLEERKNHAKTGKKDDINKTNDILKTSINNTENHHVS